MLPITLFTFTSVTSPLHLIDTRRFPKPNSFVTYISFAAECMFIMKYILQKKMILMEVFKYNLIITLKMS